MASMTYATFSLDTVMDTASEGAYPLEMGRLASMPRHAPFDLSAYFFKGRITLCYAHVNPPLDLF
jgi:hypothetical protein